MQKIVVLLLSSLLLTNCSYLKSPENTSDEVQFSPVVSNDNRVIKQNMQSVPLRKQYGDGQFTTTTSGFQNVARILPPSFDNSFGDIQSTAVVVKGNLAYVSYNTSGDEVGGAVDIIDVSNSQNPVILKTFISDTYEFSDLAIKDNYLYASGYKKNVGAVLAVMNISNNDLVVEKIVSVQGIYATDLDLLNNRLIVMTGTTGGVSEFDVSSSSNPSLVSYKDLQNGLSLAQSSWFDFYLYGNNKTTLETNQLVSYSSVYLIPGVNIYSNLISNATSAAPSRVKIKNSLMYVLNSTSHSLKLLDTSFVGRDSSEIKTMFEFPVTGTANGFDIDQQKAYLALGEKGVKVVGVNQSSATDLGDLYFSDLGSANNVWLKSNSNNAKIMFIAYGRQGTRILTENKTLVNSNKIRVMARGMGSLNGQAQLELRVNDQVVESLKNIPSNQMTVYEWTYNRILNNNDKVEVLFINDNDLPNPNFDSNLFVHYLWVNDQFCYQKPLNIKGTQSDFGLYVNGQGIRINQGVCESFTTTITQCPQGHHSCETGCTPNERPCTVTGGSGIELWTNGQWSGVCLVNSCGENFYLSNGICLPKLCTPNSTQSCLVLNGTGTKTCSNSGSGWGACVPSTCNQGYHLDAGACVANEKPCSTGHGVGVSTWNGTGWGTCVATSCDSGYLLVNGSCVIQTCVPNTSVVCSVLNLLGTKTCNSQGTSYGNCTTGTTCETGYYYLGGLCLPQNCIPGSSSSCSIPNGNGTQVCQSNGSCYGSCTPTSCNSGYYMDNGVCKPQTCTPNTSQECSVNHMLGHKMCSNNGGSWGTCVTNGTCESGYYLDAGVCKPQVCTPNSTASCNDNCQSGTKTCNSQGSSYGSCVPTTCNPGYYLDNGICKPQVCTPNATTSCSSGNGTGSQTCNSTGSQNGSCVVTACNSGYYLENGVCKPQTCLPNGTVQCVLNHLIGTSTCNSNGSSLGSCILTTTCESGYYYDAGVCKPQTCTPNSTTSCSSGNGTGTKSCSSSGSGYGSCVVTTCNSGYYMDNGVCKPQVCTPNAVTSCSSGNGTGTQTCNSTGSSLGSCVVTTCNSGYYMDNGVCKPQVCTPNAVTSCSSGNGTGNQTCNSTGSQNGSCVVTTCNSGYYLDGGVCKPQLCTPSSTQSCSVNNFQGSQTCSSNGSSWGSCNPGNQCVSGYYLDGGTCKPQVCTPSSSASCSVTNGSGTKTCNSTGSGYGSCTPTSCNSGYYLDGGVCKPQTCTPNTLTVCVGTNLLIGVSYCSSNGSSWGNCNTTTSNSCTTGYYYSNGTCLPQVCTPNSTSSCSVTNGSGTKTCTSTGSGYGSCSPTSCNSGYSLNNGVCVQNTCSVSNGVGQLKTINNPNISVYHELTSDWGSGYAYLLRLTNNGSSKINDWSVCFNYNYKVGNSGISNASIDSDYDTKPLWKLKPMSYNKIIYSGSNVTVNWNAAPGGVGTDRLTKIKVFNSSDADCDEEPVWASEPVCVATSCNSGYSLNNGKCKKNSCD